MHFLDRLREQRKNAHRFLAIFRLQPTSDRVFLDAERGVVGGGLNRLDAVSVLDADHQDVSNLEGVVPVPSRDEPVAAIDDTDRCLGVAGKKCDETFNLLRGVADEARGDFIIGGL